MASSEQTDAVTARSRTHVQSVARAIKLLQLVAEGGGNATASQLADSCGLPLPTTFHLLSTLVAEQALIKDSNRRYALGPVLGALAEVYLRQEAVPDALILPLRQLAEKTGETAYLAAWRGDTMRILMSVEGAHAVRVAGITTGSYSSGHARASGKLLLAYGHADAREAYLRANPIVPVTEKTITSRESLDQEFDKVRRRGYSEDREEFQPGVCCLSVPVMNRGAVLAAYTISSPAERFRSRRAELLEALLAAAERFSNLAELAEVELLPRVRAGAVAQKTGVSV